MTVQLGYTEKRMAEHMCEQSV